MKKIIIFIYFIRYIFNFVIEKELIDSFNFYANEICSYNGKPNIIGNTVNCSCFEGYTNSKGKTYIKGIEIQCSYKKKKRFTCFFFAAFLPIGLDYFYLERYFIFIVILFVITFVFANQLLYFLLSYKFKIEINNNLQKNNNYYLENEKNNYNNNIKDEFEKDRDVYRIYKTINFVLGVLFIVFWIVDIILQATGSIYDGNGIKTKNDMNLLFNVGEYSY